MIIKDRTKLNQQCEVVTDYTEAEKISAELLTELSSA